MSNPTQGASAPLIRLHNQTIQGSNVECVNARDLHLFLEVGRDFSSWIKTRIKQYGFEKDADFVVVENLSSPKRGSAKSRQQIMQDYYLTMDMAKELAMVERNEKGRQARRYFIECEKKLREESKAQGDTLPAPLNGENRFLMVMVGDKVVSCNPVASNAFITTFDRLPAVIQDRPLKPHQLYSIAEQCMSQASKRLKYYLDKAQA